MYIYIYVYVHVCMYVCMYVYIYVYTHTYTYVCISLGRAPQPRAAPPDARPPRGGSG